MFHKVAVLIYCIIFAFCVVVNLPNILLRLGNSLLHFHLKLSIILLLMFLFILFIASSFLFVLVAALITKVKVGKPTLETLVIAYKHGLSNTVTSTDVYRVYELFPRSDKVQICYERRLGPFGIAHGAVIHEGLDQVSEDTKAYLDRHGYRLFQMRSIPNAMYISCISLPWLSYLSMWLVLKITYPKIYKYSKKHRLSAYPVVELYRRFSIVLIVPLSQQDNFVVPEEIPFLCRSSTGLDMSLNSTAELSHSSHSRSVSNISFSKSNVNGITKLNPIHSSTPILVKKNAKHKQG